MIAVTNTLKDETIKKGCSNDSTKHLIISLGHPDINSERKLTRKCVNLTDTDQYINCQEKEENLGVSGSLKDGI